MGQTATPVTDENTNVVPVKEACRGVLRVLLLSCSKMETWNDIYRMDGKLRNEK